MTMKREAGWKLVANEMQLNNLKYSSSHVAISENIPNYVIQKKRKII